MVAVACADALGTVPQFVGPGRRFGRTEIKDAEWETPLMTDPDERRYLALGGCGANGWERSSEA
jgi:hypothetical protein